MIVRLAKLLGLHRIEALSYIYHRYLCGDPHPANVPRHDVVLKTDGQKILVADPSRSYIGGSIYYTGLWEPEATRCICSKIRPGTVAVDVGAHTGYYTLLFAKRVGPQGQVLAFEPEERGLDFLRKNIAMNGRENVTVWPVALSNRTGRLVEKECGFFISEDDQADGKSCGLEVRVFDDLARQGGLDRVDIVKIDVEGAELDVLEGMQQTLDRWHPGILLEVHPAKITRNCGRSVEELNAFLARHGYETEPVSGPSPSGNYTVFCSARPAAAESAVPAHQVETSCGVRARAALS